MPKIFNRPPRIQPEQPLGEIQIPNPPSINQAANRLGMVTMALPLVTILGYSLVASSSGGNLLTVLPMGIAAVLTTAVAYTNFRRTQRIEDLKQSKYTQLLNNLRKQMTEAHEQQQHFYQHNFPAPDHLLPMTTGEEPDSRLWERRPSDADFGMLRMGLGRLPSSVRFIRPHTENADAPQLLDALKVADESTMVTDVPVALALRQIHAAGISAPSHEQATAFVRSALIHLSALHSPNDVRLFIAGGSNAKSEWTWARWLPHTTISRHEPGAGEQLCFEADDMQTFWGRIQFELDRRQMRLQSDEADDSTVLPLLVVVIDLFNTADSTGLLEDGKAKATLSLLLNSGQGLGAAVLFLVPDDNNIPGECQAVINLLADDQALYFRYAETGVNAIRREGLADQVRREEAETFAQQLAPIVARTSYSADLPQSLTLLDLVGVSAVEDLQLMEHWEQSQGDAANWPVATIGRMMGSETRELVFEQNQGSGVHGLIAGTTGTGKSQLLMSLIIGLAIRYHPSVVNFVLVDYKGGTSFDPLKDLPHSVDVITNMHGQAGTRAFTAIRAELNRRTTMLKEARVQDIGEYHERGYHRQNPLPHLFVVIDEFAQMLKERPEFKEHLETIARLGRAPGVHLLLATQRPSGVLSEQIRANMKFRLCLRVETADDSRELLGRTDAFFLPTNIPGRAYLQVGNDKLDLIQVAQVGGIYQGPRLETQPPVIWLNRPGAEAAGADYETLSDVIIRLANQIMLEHHLEKPTKPWPDPLPEFLPLSKLNDSLADWYEDQGQWRGVNWRGAMRTQIGLLDNPAQAEQAPLTLDFTRGHVVVFGASGWGKTTLLRTVIAGLTASHSPDELWIYALDFGGRGLDTLQSFPHLGAFITPAETERVGRLFRKLSSILEERQILFSQAQVNTLGEYNRQRPDAPRAAVLLIIDNFAEFRENFSEELDSLTSLARDGRAYGIHVLVTAEQMSAIPVKIYSLFTERLALKMADSTDYASIVGRGVPEISEIPGRGFIRQERAILEFQIASPIPLRGGEVIDNTSVDETSAETDQERVVLKRLGEQMNAAWLGALPEHIGVLGRSIMLNSLVSNSTRRGVQPALGQFDLDLSVSYLDFYQQGPHFSIIGPPISGKTTALRTLALSLATYPLEQVNLVFIDFQKRLFQYGGQQSLAELPHTLATVSELPELEQLITHLTTEFAERRERGAEIFVLIDNYDDFISAVNTNRVLFSKLGELARQRGAEGLRVVIAASSGTSRMDEFFKQVAASRYGLALDAGDSLVALGARVRTGSAPELPPGRGYLVKAGRANLIQTATPQKENAEMEQSLDEWVQEIVTQNKARASWSSASVQEAG